MGHMSDFYMNCLEPLGITEVDQHVRIEPRKKDLDKTKSLLQKEDGNRLIGLQVGAGNSKRFWALPKFMALKNGI